MAVGYKGVASGSLQSRYGTTAELLKGAKTPLSAAIDGNALPIYLKEPQWAMCRIPDDHMVACETGAGGCDATLSWPASAYCS